jgi:hypothetical protein
MDAKSILKKLSDKGIPLPLLYDNDKKGGSITYTVFVIASVIVALAFLLDLYLYGCAYMGECSPPSYYPKSELLMWFGTAGGIYFGRKTFPSEKDKDGNGIEDSKENV